jgi:hypothetical protein
MDYDQDKNPRYHPVLDPTRPFGVVTSATVTVAPSVGLFSMKTANISLKIFDRSRLVEIADFINPKLYQAVTIWLTYGWRAPTYPPHSRTGSSSEVKIYSDFINENMMKREAYSVKNVTVTIEKDGTVNLNISLFTRGGSELLEIKDARSGAFDSIQQEFGAKLEQLRNLAKKLRLQSFVDSAKDLRGSTLISAALAGNMVSIDSKTLNKELSALDGALQSKNMGSEKAQFLQLLKGIYQSTGNTGTNQFNSRLDAAARAMSSTRFSSLKQDNTYDVFACPKAEDSDRKKYKDDITKRESPLARALRYTQSHVKNNRSATAESIGGRVYGDVSFGRLFAHYFSNIAQSLTKDSQIHEIQVFFYKLNNLAGPVAGINIAEFPIEMGELEKAYTKRVTDQKGEVMSFNSILEIVRESQFSNVQHSVYGFRDLYSPDSKTGQLKLNSFQDGILSQRMLENFGISAGPFTLPVLEFYIETGFSNAPEASDLLEKYDLLRNTGSSNTPNAFKKIMRIHVYDKAAIPNELASQVLSSPNGFMEVRSDALDALRNAPAGVNPTLDAIKQKQASLKSKLQDLEPRKKEYEDLKANDPKAIEKFTKEIANILGITDVSPANLQQIFRQVTFKDKQGNNSSFDNVKREISRIVPTITAGTNASAIENISYTTNQDALLSTIMMLKNSESAANPSQPNGSGGGDIPLRVIPGALSLTTMGCPLLEYMQQFFIDLGTGTTIDNLYNITQLTHTIHPGKFTTQAKFTFADAYGKYESPQTFIDGITAEVTRITDEINLTVESEQKKKQTAKSPAKKP